MSETDPLEEWARELAREHAAAAPRRLRGHPLRKRLARDRKQLIENYRATLRAVGEGRWISPAGEWLIDNFHVIDEQLREAHKSVPKRFYRQLSMLSSGPYRDLPRAFAIATELVERTDGRLDIALLQRFLEAYQQITPLTIGELWVIPNALRHAFLARLAEIAARVDVARREREAAAALAADLVRIAARTPNAVAEALRRRVAPRVQPSTTMFATELAQRLRDQDPALAPAVEWLDQRVVADGTTLEDAIRAEHRSQAANQTSVGNVIQSMRTITATDWSKVFETLSPVERVLRCDPSGDYGRMEFVTRDRYRHVIERIARRTRRSEREVAEAAVALAAAAPEDPRKRHVGYYLIEHGVVALGEALGYRPGLRERGGRVLVGQRTALYLGAIALATVAAAAGVYACALALAIPMTAVLVLTLVSLLPASEIGLSVVNLIIGAVRPPLALPKLDFSDGIPEEHRTLVVIPAMLGNAEVIDELLEWIELHHLGNQQRGLVFALLTDPLDAPTREEPHDGPLLSAAIEGIRRLDRKHGPGRFFLLHRHRVECPTEHRFMGWERKRGKLEELNRLLCGADDTTISTIIGDVAILRGCRYVLTLDADTQLPHGSAIRLVGAMAHPLNRPRLDPHTQAVIGGHAILQPRVSVSPVSARQSAFAKLFSQQEGVDPYTIAVSDVYQDLFDEGSFVGKGIYDVRAFLRAQNGRIPENAVLSHDLIEGNFARSGLVSDVELFDDTPSHYLAASRRRHRWIRGDWQIAPWLGDEVPHPDDAEAGNPLSVLARWKIFDNLRRSLVAPATLALLLGGWTLTHAPLRWTGVVAGLLALPLFALWLTGALRTPFGASWRSGVIRVTSDTLRTALRSILTLLFLPHEAWVSIDAITRALYRMGVSHEGLLEWVPSAATERSGRGVGPIFRAMAPGLLFVLVAFGVACGLTGWRGAALAPLVLAWLLAPFIAARISQPTIERERKLSVVARHLLRRTARKTWRYFEELVVEGDHFLPPDNFQEEPSPVVAHRTSPTNIGLSLLASLSAYELGYVGLRTSLLRLEQTIGSIERLERHRGHLLNWYDTKTLQPLQPRYVSMVDSGNLAGALIAVKQACLRDQQARTIEQRVPVVLEGLIDTLRLVEEHAGLVAGRDAAALRDRIAALEPLLGQPPTELAAAREWLAQLRERIAFFAASLPPVTDDATGALARWVAALVVQVEDHLAEARAEDDDTLDARLEAIAQRAEVLLGEMDFRFLFDDERQLFAIGHDVSADRRDGSFYDLLASEARLGSFVAIAQGQVPVSHWHKLGRPLTRVAHRRALLSWSGSMFEYLMPSLLLASYPRTLLDETCRAVVQRQLAYGRETRVPWGISEAAYNARDLNLNYQYGPFGVPGLGVKRGLADDVVVAPYATALALVVDPVAAAENLWRLTAEGMDGQYGFYESIDYTPPRVPEGERGAVIRAFMAHHQGMTLVSISEYLHERPLREAFRADPRIKATELLLQERIPYDVPLVERHGEGLERARPVGSASREPWRPFDVEAEPEVQLLSNGGYSMMLSSAGGGYSRWRGLEVTRWREDATRDCFGQFLYLRDERGRVWSAAHEPTRLASTAEELCFSLDKAELRRTEHGIESHLLVSVATEDDAEVRALTLTNRSSSSREIEVTSYAEVVLAPHAADLAHPAFAKLFVETELVAPQGALLAHRRPREHDEPQAFAVHVCAVVGDLASPPEHETSRERFLGRWREPNDPQAIATHLTGTTGPVLDPIFSLRRRIRIPTGKSVRLLFTTAVADSRSGALALAEKYAHVDAADRAPALSWTHAQSQLHYLDIGVDDARTFRRLAARLLYADRRNRAADEIVARNTRGQSALWAYGISGDVPILLVRVAGAQHLELVKTALHAHEFWHMRGFEVDLVLWNEHPPTYLQSFQDELVALARSRAGGHLVDKRGGIFVRRADLVPPEDQNTLLTVARVILAGSRGSLTDQLDRPRPLPKPAPAVQPARPAMLLSEGVAFPSGLRAFNGLGGFSKDGREYVLRVDREHRPPAPWCNVLCNARFGSLVTEAGSGYEWCDNAHENRLTEWSNDPVSDPPSTAIYVRDDESGALFSPTPLPAGGDAQFLVRHGQGYTIFESTIAGLRCELTVLVASNDPVKLTRLVVENRSRATRRLTVTGYVEWTLGVTREEASRHVVTHRDDETGALIARNVYPGDCGSRISFVDTVPAFRSYTGDRRELLGPHGSTADPAGLRRAALSGRVGASLDPCAAVQVPVTLAPGESKSVVLLLGQAVDLSEARMLLGRFADPMSVGRELDAVAARWDQLLGAIQIDTPDEAMNLLANRWLLYQVVSSRLWGRTGLYQSGGAFGFRDQLQDVGALLYAQPRLAREHLLRAASRQFVEGDAQHWWHPPSGRGVRTRFSDDYLWLPFLVARYLEVTEDRALLDEEVSFLEARPLNEGEQEAYLLPTISNERASLYEHCVRALDRALKVGAHGLPLMGCGDWNDGMSRVGAGGRGESVWMAWFLIANLRGYAPICGQRGDETRAARYRAHAEALAAAVEEHAWDGEWYQRAFFDDGTALGTSKADECRIDSIAQSWSVISVAGRPERARRAMASANSKLVDGPARLVKLLTPPFDRIAHDPGYIKGYVPGVRENGGQYTHAAVWLALAEAMLGHGDRAAELLAMSNPITRSATAEDVARYRIEPYVLAGDIAAAAPHVGRGGWSWYTGSASWMYRVIVESVLGIGVRGDTLSLAPCIPSAWPGFTATYRHGRATYRIRVENPHHTQNGAAVVELDGVSQPTGVLRLVDDGASHEVHVVLAAPAAVGVRTAGA